MFSIAYLNLSIKVIVETVDGIDIWYGNLSNINVKLYDYIDKGSLIGNCNNTLFLVHKSFFLLSFKISLCQASPSYSIPKFNEGIKISSSNLSNQLQ